jgi:hypothetical protein
MLDELEAALVRHPEALHGQGLAVSAAASVPASASVRTQVVAPPSATVQGTAQMSAAMTVPQAPLVMPAYAAPPGRARARGNAMALAVAAFVLVAGGVAAIVVWQAQSSTSSAATPSTTSASARGSAAGSPVARVSSAATTAPSATPPAPTPSTAPAPSAVPNTLTSAEVERRLKDAGWSIAPQSVRDERSPIGVVSNFGVSKADLHGIVELSLYDDELVAAQAFRAADGHVPRDTRLGRDGRLLLRVQVLGEPAEAMSLTELLTR